MLPHNDFPSIRINPDVGMNIDYFFAISGLSHRTHLLFALDASAVTAQAQIAGSFPAPLEDAISSQQMKCPLARGGNIYCGVET